MPRVLEKNELLKSVVNASRQDRFWFDTVHPSNGHAVLTFPESLSGHEVQVVYVPVRKSPKATKSADAAMSKWDALVQSGKGRLAKPYRFSRADAYDEESA